MSTDFQISEKIGSFRSVPFGEVITEAQNGFAEGRRHPQGVIQLRMNNVETNGRFNWEQVIRVPATQEQIVKYRLAPGDILFNNTNSVELVGKSALFSAHSEDVVFSNHFTRLRVKHEIADAAYVALWLRQQWNNRVFEDVCNRWIGQSAVKNDKLFALSIPLLSLDEQRRMVTRLNEQMAEIEKARAALNEQDHLLSAMSVVVLDRAFEESA